MSEKIIVIDLCNMTSDVREYSYEKNRVYGRGLVLSLFREFVPDGAERYSPDNIIAIVPGLLAGNPAPSACRMLVATIRAEDQGIEICNTTGNMPQKLGSLGIAAIVIKGRSAKKSAIVHIDSTGVELSYDDQLNGANVTEITAAMKGRYGKDCAVIGSSIAGDMRLSLSTFFCTYPDGFPEFHSPRNGFGDVWGAKNLRAVVIEGKDYFSRECTDAERFRALGKQLSQRIVNDKVCGGALPAYGSMTILKILNSGADLSDMPVKNGPGVNPESRGRRLNRNCAPMCVIGCLNRHADEDGSLYGSPAQIETQAAIEKCFGLNDPQLAGELQKKATNIGIVGPEFVTACKTFALADNITDGEKHLLEWLDEIEKGSLLGRVIASRTHGIGTLFSDVEMSRWMDRKAVQDEKLFKLKINTSYPRLSGLSEYELLYSQIFVLENLGFCIFTSFALLDRIETFELLAEMFEARTGVRMTGEIMIAQANQFMNSEREYHEHRWLAAQKSNIPPFTRVLYRYFGDKQEQ